MSYKILVTEYVDPEGIKYLLDKGYEIKYAKNTDEITLYNEVIDCDAILVRMAKITKKIMENGKKLKVVSRHGIGVDNIDISAATKLGIQVTNSPTSNCNSVAEQTIGFIIACGRNFLYCYNELKNGNYEIRNSFKSFDLENKTLGIIGLGKIGSLVAKKSYYGLNMKILAYDPYKKQEEMESYITKTQDWNFIFKNSDFISIHVPLNEETRKFIGLNEFSMMKNSSYFINTSRGKVIHEPSLIHALQNKLIRGAAIDVFEEEPPKPDNPLFKYNNLIVTPHNAGVTKESLIRMSLQSSLGIHEVLSNKTISFPINSIK